MAVAYRPEGGKGWEPRWQTPRKKRKKKWKEEQTVRWRLKPKNLKVGLGQKKRVGCVGGILGRRKRPFLCTVQSIRKGSPRAEVVSSISGKTNRWFSLLILTRSWSGEGEKYFGGGVREKQTVQGSTGRGNGADFATPNLKFGHTRRTGAPELGGGGGPSSPHGAKVKNLVQES